MKAKHVLIAIVSLFIIESINQNVTMDPILFSTIENILYILLGICLILLGYIIIRQLLNSPKPPSKREQEQAKTMDDINKELDDIEAELDAMTSKNERITPIWEIPSKKK